MKATLIASEGGAGYYPENTNYAVAKSLAAGTDGCELDFHLTADKVFVAHHDYELNPALTRASNGVWLSSPGPLIKQTTLKELRRYDLGGLDPNSKLSRRYPDRLSIDGESIATLQQIEATFRQCPAPNAALWFEAKTDPTDRDRTTSAEEYVAELCRVLIDSELRSKTVLIAFEWRLLQLAKQQIPDLQTGFLTVDVSWLSRSAARRNAARPDQTASSNPINNDKNASWFADHNPEKYGNSYGKAVKAAGGTYWSPYFRDLSNDAVAEAHHHGIKVSSWGADSRDEIRQALSTGIDSLTTGYVARAKKVQQELPDND